MATISSVDTAIITSEFFTTVDFYKENFGLKETTNLGWYVHLAPDGGGPGISIIKPGGKIQSPLDATFKGDGVLISLVVDDVDDCLAALRAKGVPIVLEMTGEDTGERHFCARDPNGVILNITSM